MSTFNVLKKNQDFQIVFAKGHSIKGKYLVVYFLPNNLAINRYGLGVGRKLGSAVRRNRYKRLIREAIRKLDYEPSPGWDIIIVALTKIAGAKLEEIIVDIRNLLKKAALARPKISELTETSP